MTYQHKTDRAGKYTITKAATATANPLELMLQLQTDDAINHSDAISLH